jgi:diguanylate cyclase (GGDEF)-like protein
VAQLSPGEQRTAYLLAGETNYAATLEAALSGAGFEVHRFTDAEELAETVGALVPAAVLITPDSFGELAPVATAVASARKRANAPILLITIAADGGIPTRLAAMRAGADAFLAEPAEPAQVVARLGELDAAGATDPFRVMIVEDDRPQAVFAESILRKAGMQTRAVHDPLEAIDALEAFDPELILMDLLMPGCDGIELTTLIRERDRYANVPIVFLSGEQNADRRYDALSVGGDDFLEKPIKPKFLLSAVGNRVRRARAMRQKGGSAPHTERAPALYDRTRLVERAGESLSGATTATPGGLLFLIVDGAQALREKLGLMAFDLALQQAGAMLAESLGPSELAARFGDSSFIVLAPQSNRESLTALAARLSRAFADRLIQSESGGLTLAASTGIALFNQGWRDAPAMVNAAERAATRARSGGGERIAISVGPESNDASDADAALRNAVIAALAAGGLQLLFQPVAALHGGGDEIFQVLLRLRDERGRRYSAAEIVPMAERNGLIDDIDRAVLARCAEVLSKQQARGRPTTLLVSQSIHALADSSRIEWLTRTVNAAGVPADRLMVELRHDEVAPRLGAAASWLGALRSAGFRSAIGTFEPNAAAVQSLQHLPMDLLRISGRFVAQMDKARAAVLGDVVGAVHAHGARVVVPMVEDARTAAALWGTGVDFIQGDFVQGAGSDLEFDFNAATF